MSSLVENPDFFVVALFGSVDYPDIVPTRSFSGKHVSFLMSPGFTS